ncbi:MAG: hypothetical protein KBG28_19310 [Kofleriaceae bacterium]|jgi:hypothetical protein|nr:hypothetical protein [Kofleriaceae bacterium]
MSGGAPRNPDRTNIVGIVVVGICGAAMVYLSIAFLQAFYADDTAQVDTMADYGGQDNFYRTVRAEQVGVIETARKGAVTTGGKQTYTMSIDRAIAKVAEDAKRAPDHLVPSQCRSNKPSIEPAFGRPKPLAEPPACTPEAGGDAP